MNSFFSSHYIEMAVVVVAVFTVYMAVIGVTKRRNIRSRFDRSVPDAYISTETGQAERKQKNAAAEAMELLLPALGVNLEDKRKYWSRELARAGLSSPNSVAYLLFFKTVVQPILLVIGLIILSQLYYQHDLTTSAKLGYVVAGGVLVLIGFRGVTMYLDNVKQKRHKVLRRSFSEALDLLLVCIEAGLTLDGALARVCKELKAAHPVITSELEKTKLELTLLNDRVLALQNLADRTVIAPFKSLISALIQTEKFGTSLSETLRALSEEERVNRLMNAENRAARTPVLVTLPLIVFIMPAFLAVILGPPFIRLIDPAGTASIPGPESVNNNKK